MKDTIYREDAINAIMGEYPDLHYPSWYAEILKKLPSAEPKTGKQIEGRDERFVKCSECGMACEFTNMSQPEDGYCNWGTRKDER